MQVMGNICVVTEMRTILVTFGGFKKIAYANVKTCVTVGAIY